MSKTIVYFALKYIILFKASELILNQDGSIYHLHLKPHDISDTIITVGDPDRVSEVSKHFDSIIVKKNKREFVTHTGFLGKKLVTVISTGIGTDNIDIVLTELDALANIDLETKEVKKEHKQLTLIRIGTSGCLQKELPVDSFLFSSAAIGIDNLMHFYDLSFLTGQVGKKHNEIKASFQEFLNVNNFNIPGFYPAFAEQNLVEHFGLGHHTGITMTCSGFYGPQGRSLRINSKIHDFLRKASEFSFDGQLISNLEMETAGIYGMANALGHQAISCNALLANRITGAFSSNPKKSVAKLIEYCLEKILKL